MLGKILVVMIALSMTACLKTRSEMAEENEKQVIQSQVSQIQKAKADQDANLQSYEAQIRTLNGRVETLEHQVSQLSTEKEGLSKKLTENDERFKQLEQALLQVEQQREQSVTLKPAPQEEKKDSGKKPKSAYDEGEDFYNNKQWKKAVVQFQKYRDASPSGTNVAAATLKIGICFQEMKMNKEAKVFFEEVLDKHSKSRFAKIAQTRLAQLKKK